MMLSSCMFVPPKEKEEKTQKETGVVQTPANGTNDNASGNNSTDNLDNNSGNDTANQGDNSGTGSGNTDGTSETPVQTKHGLSLVWNDEFNYTGVPNTSKWKYQTGAGGWGNNELQNYLDNTTEAKTAATSPPRSHSTRCPFLTTPRALYIFAMMRATVVLPVPGLPVKTMWYEIGATLSPAALRCCATRTNDANFATSSLTGLRPTSSFSSASASSTVTSFVEAGM